MTNKNQSESIDLRSTAIMARESAHIRGTTGRQFAALICMLLLGVIVTVMIASPYTWGGNEKVIHMHASSLIGLGLLIASFPVFFAWRQVLAKTDELFLVRRAAEKSLSDVSLVRLALDQHTLLSFTDRSGKISDANAGFCRVSGYSREELIGQDHRILNSGYHPRSFWMDMWKTIASGKEWRSEVCNRAKDGSLYWVDSTILPQLGKDGKPEKYIMLRIDITSRKNAEESLKSVTQRNQLLAAAVERSPDATVVTDLQGIVRFANPAAHKLDAMFGHELHIGSQALLFSKGRIKTSIVQNLIENIRAGRDFHDQFPCQVDASGNTLEFRDCQTTATTKFLSVTASPLMNSQGEIDGILLVKREITDEVLKTRFLEEITTVMDAATDCVFIADVETGTFVYANHGAIKHLGFERDELRSMTPFDINPHFDRKRYSTLIEPLISSPGSSIKFRSEHVHRDGHTIPVEISMQLIPGLGPKGRFLSMVRDITEQLKSEIALETERDKAEMSSRSKSEFLANMSHEIRTPMTAILGFADLLDSDFSKDPMQTAHAIHTIQSNANHLLTIINDILDMSKIEAGKMTVEEIHISPSQIVEEAVSLMRPRAIGKGMDIRLNYETAIPTRIKSDPTRLR